MKPLKTRVPTAPKHLSEKAKTLWKSTLTEYELEPEALETLRVALENLDLADEARRLLRDEGLVVNGKKHPASDSCKLHDGMFLRAMRALGLDIVQPNRGVMGRPPGSGR